jgi:hypothetical protein
VALRTFCENFEGGILYSGKFSGPSAEKPEEQPMGIGMKDAVDAMIFTLGGLSIALGLTWVAVFFVLV